MDLSVVVTRHKSWVVSAGGVLPLVVCGALAALRTSVPNATAVLILVLVVVAAASTGIRMAGFVAALSSGVWFDFFLTQPYRTFAITDGGDLEAAALLVVIGAAVTEVALWGHRQQAHARRRAGYVDGVLATAEIVSLRDQSPTALVDHIAVQIRQILEVSRCEFVTGPVRDARTPVLDHQGQVTRNDHVIDVERDGLPTDDRTALVVSQGKVLLGHFLLTAAGEIARPTLEQRRVAVLLANQVGSVLADQSP